MHQILYRSNFSDVLISLMYTEKGPTLSVLQLIRFSSRRTLVQHANMYIHILHGESHLGKPKITRESILT